MASRSGRRQRANNSTPLPPPNKQTAVLYARVSSADQERGGFSIPAQERLLREYATTHGLRVVAEYVDVETAKAAGRTRYNEMLKWLKRNRRTCRTILVEKTDRLYRNFKDYVVLDDLDLDVHLVKEGVVLSDDARSTDKFMHGIRVLMAKNYIDNLREEATKGMLEKARQGIWPSRAPIGYRNALRADGKKVIEVDEDRAPLVRQLFEWCAEGTRSLTELTVMVNDAGLTMARTGTPITRATVHRTLQNPLYRGDVVWRDEIHDGIHTPLVSRALWRQAQQALSGRYQNQRGKTRRHEFAFAGLINCGHCGCALSGQIQKERYIYYHCTGFKGDCGEAYVRQEVFAEKFEAALRTLSFSQEIMDLIARALRESHAEQTRFHREAVERLEKQCQRLQQRIDAAYVDKLDGVIDGEHFARLSRQWHEQLRERRENVGRHEEANQSNLEEGIKILDLGREAADLFPQQSPAEQRKLLDYMVSNCTWAADELIVTWHVPYDILAEFAKNSEDASPADLAKTGETSPWVTPAGFEPASSA